MLKLKYIILAVLIFPSQLSAQIVQKGRVRLLNSGNKPIAGVQVIFSDAPAVISDTDGNFRLVFYDKKPGDLIFMENIYKKGYELVNEKELEVIRISNTDQLGVEIVLALEGTIEAAKKEYYNISDEALLAGFQREKVLLRKELQQSRINQQEYLNRIQDLQSAYERQKESLDFLAEKFARINFDNVEPYYVESLESFKEGDIDQAIAVLESTNPIKRTQQIIQEEIRIALAEGELNSQRLTLEREKQKQIAAVRLLADMYSLMFDPVRAEAQYDQLIQLDSTSLEILWDAAAFYRSQHRYNKAMGIYSEIVDHSKAEDWQKGNAYAHLGELNKQIGDLDEALKVLEQYKHVYDTLSNKNPSSSFYTHNLAVSYEKLGSSYALMGKLDSALLFYSKYKNLEQGLYEAYPENTSFKYGLAISFSKLGSIYTSLGQLDSALHYNKKDLLLTRELYEASPQDINLKNGLAISYENLGLLFTSIGQLDSALFYLQTSSRVSKELFHVYPHNVDFKNSLATSFSKLATVYMSLSQLDSALFYNKENLSLNLELSKSYPQNVSFKNGLAISYEQMGSTYTSMGQLDSALFYYKQFLYIKQQLNEGHPQNVSFKNGLAISYSRLGETYTSLEQLDSALFYFQRSSQIGKELYNLFPQNTNLKNSLAISYYYLGTIYLERTEIEKAIHCFQETETHWLELQEQYPHYQEIKTNLSFLQSKLAAIREMNSEDILVQNRLKKLHVKEDLINLEEDFAKKINLLEAVIRSYLEINGDFPNNNIIQSRLSSAYGNLAWYNLFISRFNEAENASLKGLAVAPSEEWLNTNLAHSLLFQGKWDEAKYIYQKFKGKAYNEQLTWRNVFFADLDELEKAGITHPDVEKIRKMLQQ